MVINHLSGFTRDAVGSIHGLRICMRVDLPKIVPLLSCGVVSNGQHPGLQQAGGSVHQGIARHGGLAKNRSPYLIRRDEPPSGALPLNAILRFEKAANTYHVVFLLQTKDIPYVLSGSFIRILGGAFGLVFFYRPGQAGGFAFQPARELLASIGPGVGQTLSSLDILKFRLGLLHDQRTG